jgi:dolichol-phosphate mannosyltransferase
VSPNDQDINPALMQNRNPKSNPDLTRMLSLVIPTYNEAHNIKPLIRRIFPVLQRVADSFEVIIVDDDSPDQTWQIAQELADTEPRLRVIRRVDDRGLATAVVAGWKAAKGEILGVMDGDLQHDPETLEKLIHAIETTPADIVIASRHVKEGGVSDWNVLRRSISWGATCLATFVIPGILRNVRDPMSGYFLVRRAVIASARLEPTGYKILLEVLAKGTYRAVREMPYIFEERKVGKSKLGPKQYWDYLSHLARLARETGELDRLIRFCTVGVTGVVVNETALWFLTNFLGLYYLYSSIGAVEVAIVTNFLLNEFWTFRDKASRATGTGNRARRFIKFNLICAVGGILNTSVLWALTAWFGINYLYSNLVGIALGTIWNYAMNANITWGVLISPDVQEAKCISSDLNNAGRSEVLDEERRKVWPFVCV